MKILSWLIFYIYIILEVWTEDFKSQNILRQKRDVTDGCSQELLMRILSCCDTPMIISSSSVQKCVAKFLPAKQQQLKRLSKHIWRDVIVLARVKAGGVIGNARVVFMKTGNQGQMSSRNVIVKRKTTPISSTTIKPTSSRIASTSTITTVLIDTITTTKSSSLSTVEITTSIRTTLQSSTPQTITSLITTQISNTILTTEKIIDTTIPSTVTTILTTTPISTTEKIIETTIPSTILTSTVSIRTTTEVTTILSTTIITSTTLQSTVTIRDTTILTTTEKITETITIPPTTKLETSTVTTSSTILTSTTLSTSTTILTTQKITETTIPTTTTTVAVTIPSSTILTSTTILSTTLTTQQIIETTLPTTIGTTTVLSSSSSSSTIETSTTVTVLVTSPTITVSTVISTLKSTSQEVSTSKTYQNGPMCIIECAFRSEGMLNLQGEVNVSLLTYDLSINFINSTWDIALQEAVTYCTAQYEVHRTTLTYFATNFNICNPGAAILLGCIYRHTTLNCPPSMTLNGPTCNEDIQSLASCDPFYGLKNDFITPNLMWWSTTPDGINIEQFDQENTEETTQPAVNSKITNNKVQKINKNRKFIGRKSTSKTTIRTLSTPKKVVPIKRILKNG